MGILRTNHREKETGDDDDDDVNPKNLRKCVCFFVECLSVYVHMLMGGYICVYVCMGTKI